MLDQAGTSFHPAATSHDRWRSQRCLRALTLLLLCWSLAACAVSWISPYSKESADRIGELSKSVLGMYQDAFLLDEDKRAEAFKGPYKVRQAEIETRIRLHLLQEEARPNNKSSVRIAGDMLDVWQSQRDALQRADPTARSDVALGIHRRNMNDLLRAALVAEEAKKSAGLSN